MTTTDDTSTTDATTTEEPETTAPEEPTPEEQAEDGGKASREAATYRRRLRETETERDDLRTTVEALQRQEVERLAAAELAAPAALWRAEGVDLTTMLDDNGRVDPGKVTAAIADAKAALGLAGPPTGPSLDLGHRGAPPASPKSWSDLLAQR